MAVQAPRRQGPAVTGSPLYARAHELDDHIRSLGLRRRQDKTEMAQDLWELKRGDLFKQLGYTSITAYGRTVAGLGASTTSELLKIVEGCQRLPLTREAFMSGRLPARKAGYVVEVATPENEAEWLKKADELDEARLRAAAREEPPQHRYRNKWTDEEFAWVDDAVRDVRERGGPLEFSAALAEVCRRYLVGGEKPRAQLRVVIQQDPHTGEATRETSRGPVPVSAETVELAQRTGKVIDLREGSPERSFAKEIPQEIREHVAARDGGRCCVPGCTNRAYLEADHLKGRANGHSVDEIQELCGAHHRARHRGLLRVEGVGADRRFYLADGTTIGRAGDRVRADLRPTPFADASSSGEIGLEQVPGADEFAAANSSVPQARDEMAYALKALRATGVTARRAEALRRRVLEEEPHLAGAAAGEILHALFVRY